MDVAELVTYIDHSMLRPDAGAADIERACDEAAVFGFRGVCVPSGAVGHARRLLTGSAVKVVSTVGFPHGNAAPDVKAHEATRAAAMGADELDYVISIGAALDGDWRFVREEAIAVTRAVRGKLVKAILEVGYLDEDRMFRAAAAVADAGVAYVKTCTGFGPGAATEENVAILARAVQGRALVKASGGIRERWQALRLIAAGASVIGTSRGVAMCTA